MLEGNACVGGERQSGLRFADWGFRVSVRVLIFLKQKRDYNRI